MSKDQEVLGSALVWALISCAGGPSNGAAQADSLPPFTYHGVIEGFYGSPWSHQDRLDVLAFMGEVGLNTYFYAPKNDPYHRTRWREPYPPHERQQLTELVSAAGRYGVAFWYAISPGLSMVYSDSADYRDLMAKIDTVAAMGVAHIGLFVDDVPVSLAHPADREAFESLAQAHVVLANRLQADLSRRGIALAVTPTTYTGAWGDRAYIDQLGVGLHPEVRVLWTGTDVVSPRITADEARQWSASIRRPPFVWDNYPVNDFAAWRVFLGPVVGRDEDLSNAVAGFVSNPMNQAHASMIALATLADYVTDPGHYNPQSSLARALERLYGSDGAQALQPFVNAFGDYGWDTNVFEPLFILRNDLALDPIRRDLDGLHASLRALRGLESVAVGHLVTELTPMVRRIDRRLAELEDDPGYDQRDNRLVYRSEVDTYHAARRDVQVDGGLAEWASAEWRTLTGARGSRPPSVAFAGDDSTLYLALRVAGRSPRVLEYPRIGEGEHIAVIVDTDTSDRTLSARDIVALFPPPTERSVPSAVLALDFRGFVAKWLGDNEHMTLTEFQLTTFGTPALPAVRDRVAYAARQTDTGYDAEIGVPRNGQPRMRVSLVVASRQGGRRVIASLSRRNYAGNPGTYATITLPD